MTNGTQYKSFRELKAWQKSMELTDNVYKCTRDFPKEEVYALCSQIRRSAISIPSNIAEGQQRTSPKEFAHFLSIAKGSLAELDTQIEIAYRQGMLSLENFDSLKPLILETDKMIYGLIRSQKAK
jgi:four helix bundle protein